MGSAGRTPFAAQDSIIKAPTSERMPSQNSNQQEAAQQLSGPCGCMHLITINFPKGSPHIYTSL